MSIWLQNLVAEFGCDTTENEPRQLCYRFVVVLGSLGFFVPRLEHLEQRQQLQQRRGFSKACSKAESLDRYTFRKMYAERRFVAEQHARFHRQMRF